MELYGSNGSLYLPDPNFFGGEVILAESNEKADAVEIWTHPFGVENDEHPDGMRANYRCAGVADMMAAIDAGRPHRCSLELAIHVVDVMTSILRSGEEGAFVTLTISCERPAPLGPKDATALLRST